MTVTEEVKQEETATEEVKTAETKTEEAATVTPDYETFFEKEWGKKPTEFKAEYDELLKLRETAQTAAEKKFANEQSELLYNYLVEGKEDEAFALLEKKRTLAAAEGMPAAEAIRLSLKMSNPHYTDVDVQDVFEEKYAVPEKPVRDEIEEDSEYEARLGKWQAQVDKVTRRIERDAVAAKGELAKLKTEIVLPHIQKGASAAETAEAQSKEADRLATLRTQYLQALEANHKAVKGYETVFKDKEVEFPVSYTIEDDEKAAYKSRLENFDVEGFITTRWFNQDGSPNVTQLMEDIYLLDNKSKVFQKLANEAGSQRFEHYLKTQGKFNVTGKAEGTFNPTGEKADTQKAAEFFFRN